MLQDVASYSTRTYFQQESYMATLANFSLTVQKFTKIIKFSATVVHVCINSHTLYTHNKMNHALD